MATYTKPASVPRWSDTGGNVIEPPEAKKDAGWLFQEIPPSSFENWRTKLNGDWWKWVNERLADVSGDPDALAILDPSGINPDPVVEVDGKVLRQSNFIFRDGLTNSTLRVTKNTQELTWLAGAVESFKADQFRLRVGPSDSDYTRIFGAGDIKGLTFDSNLNQLRYRISTDTFGFYCNSGTASLEVTPDRVRHLQPIAGVPQINIGSNTLPAATHSRFENGLHIGADATVLGNGQAWIEDRLTVGDAAFYMERFGAGNDPMLAFNTDDTSIQFDVSADLLNFYNGGNLGMTIYPDIGNDTFVGANAFIPANTGDFNTLRYESGARNAIQMQCKGSFLSGGSITAGSRPWNVDSVENTSLGNYRVHPIQAISNYSCPVAGVDGGGLLGRVIAFHSTQSYIGVTTITSAGGTSSAFLFNLIVTGA